ncbi:serine/threonine-protein kinase PknK [Pendulispora albinea]|uniref:Protein kinase n=1 Tax=Pendulispora albinea TaxID=2741071 RepID=A0ABZ2LUD0_9BACT
MAARAAPHQLAHFEVVRRLGAGGMAEVFLAKKRGAEGTFKLLVVKRILPTHGASRRFRAMFIEEAQLATRLNHPNVVQVFEFYDGGDEGQLLAMEYVEGPDLGMLMASAKAKGTRLPPWVGAWAIAEAAKGLHYAHEKKDEGGAPLDIVHRDVSPQNVLLSYEGAVKIADFGIASARLFVEETGVIKGKFGYMSPEQARGENVDRRSDLYALGVIFWEILAGRPIHGGLGGEALLDIVRSGFVEPPSTYVRDVPTELEAIAMKALEPRREDRYATARDLSAAIARALLAKQVLVDASTLEATIAQLVAPRSNESSANDDGANVPGASFPPSITVAPSADDEHELGASSLAGELAGDAGSIRGAAKVSVEENVPSVPSSLEQRTQAAVPLAKSSVDFALGLSHLNSAPLRIERSIPPPASERGRPTGPREVRHVAVVTLRLHGVEELLERDRALGERTLDRLRTMLGDIAYKRGMRCWIWSSDTEARAVAGLTRNPGRAAFEAAWLALDTHEAISGMTEDLPIALGASLGIVRGIASGARDPHGNLVRYRLHDPATYLADVVGQETPRGRTWVAGGVYRLVRRDFRWGDATTLQLDPRASVDNVPPTMRIYALERSLSREERLAELSAAPNDLVGRDAEKADLHAAYHRAVSSGSGDGSGKLTARAVVGEMGIGKTALVTTFLAELPPNARIVRATCSPVKMEVPFSAAGDIVRDAIGTTGEEPFDDVVDLVARAGGGSAQGDASHPVVARLAELATNRPLGGGDDEHANYRRKLVSQGLRALLAAIALQQPLVLVVEGLQWADKQSHDLLGEIIHSDDPLPLLILLVSRPDDRSTALLDGVVRIELQALSSDEQVRLVETRLGVRKGVRNVCADLLPRVGGNPFFLLEMVDALLERGTLEIREERIAGDPSDAGAPGAGAPDRIEHVLVRTERSEGGLTGLPSTLEQLLGDRLRELPREEHAVIDWLAIAGGPLLLGDLTRLTRAQGDDAVVRLCARGLCDRKGDVIDFRHPLTRDVAYLALAPGDRVVMHRTLGEHLGRTNVGRGLSAAIVARHLARGEAGEQAADFYLEAALAAKNGNQVPLAVRYYNRALAYLPLSDARRVVAHESLESIFRVLGRRLERIRHLEALRKLARAQGTPRVTCLALLRSARFDLDDGRLAHGLPLARRAAEVAHGCQIPNYEIDAEAMVSEFLRELGSVQGALAASDRALAACDPNVNPQVPPRARADVLRARGVLLRRVGRVREAVDSYVDAIAVFRKVGARRQEARAKHTLAFALFCQGRYEDSIALAFESIQLDLAIGGRFQLANTLTNIGHAYAKVGDIPRALAYLKRARDAHVRYNDQDAHADTLTVSAEVMAETGQLDEAEHFLEQASALTAVTHNAYDETHELVIRAELQRLRRNAHAAIVQAIEARRTAEDRSLVSFHFYGLAIEAAARVEAGEMHAATLLATTVLGAVETLQGCEYGVEIRVLCADALKRAGSPQAPQAHQRAVDHAVAVASSIRDARLRTLFLERPVVSGLFDKTPVPQVVLSGVSESLEP